MREVRRINWGGKSNADRFFAPRGRGLSTQEKSSLSAKILGLDTLEGKSKTEITSAFRRRAQKYHPDKVKIRLAEMGIEGANEVSIKEILDEEFKVLNEAYQFSLDSVR